MRAVLHAMPSQSAEPFGSVRVTERKMQPESANRISHGSWWTCHSKQSTEGMSCPGLIQRAVHVHASRGLPKVPSLDQAHTVVLINRCPKLHIQALK